MAYNFKSEAEVKEYLDNLGTEYRFGCFSEKKGDVCHLLGDYMESVKKDFPKAANLFRSTCDDYQFPRSCYKFASYSLIGKGCQANNEQAVTYFKKGCEYGDRDSCLYSGLMLVSSEDNKVVTIKRDYPSGMGFLKKACEAGSGMGCFHLSGLYLSGIPGKVEVDMKKAFELSVKGCEAGNLLTCANLSRMYARGDGCQKDEALSAKFKARALELQKEQKEGQKIDMQQGTHSL